MSNDVTKSPDRSPRGRLFYIGAPCSKCGFRKRYISSRHCFACRKQRAMDLQDSAPARFQARKVENERKAKWRAKLKSGAAQPQTLWHALINLINERN